MDAAELAARALAWDQALIDAVCDSVEPWAHGQIVKSSSCPDIHDVNGLIVDGDPGLGLAELSAIARDALADVRHLRIDFSDIESGRRLRPDFEEAHWKTEAGLIMHHDGSRPKADTEVPIEPAPFEATLSLREAWHDEDSTGRPFGELADQIAAITRLCNGECYVVRDGGEPVAYSQINRVGGSCEIGQLYVRAGRRGQGLGTALTCAAIEEAGHPDDLWIGAEDEGRPKELYAQLGFEPAWRWLQALWLPEFDESARD